MYRGFNLDFRDFDRSYFVDSYLSVGQELHESVKGTVKSTLESFRGADGKLIASNIIAEWFPSVEANVFLSHSHRDEPLVIAFAGWLHKELGLMPFIDSSVWGYSDDLLRIIDNEYCYNEERKIYDYKRRNRSTSHVYMMLSTALIKMINQCEAVFFLDTPNSISSVDYIAGEKSTDSPWIYSEIAMTSVVQRRTLDDHREIRRSWTTEAHVPQLEMQYNVDLSHLTSLAASDLINWQENSKSKIGSENLDLLYGTVRG